MARKINGATLLTMVICYCTTPLALATDYAPAFDATKRAAYISTGADVFVESFSKHIIKKTTLERPLMYVASGYKVYTDKAISFPVANNKKITINNNCISVEVKI